MQASIQESPVTVTGELSLKRVGDYLRKSHKGGLDIRVQRDGDGFFLADGFIAVRVGQHPDLLPFTFFPGEWERATFKAKEQVATEGGPDIAALWKRWMSHEPEWDQLTLTPFLYECAGERNKPGQISRRFVTYDLEQQEKYRVYLDKKLTDTLTPGIEELEGFLFETKCPDQPVRVAARNGYVAVIMPFFMKGKG